MARDVTVTIQHLVKPSAWYQTAQRALLEGEIAWERAENGDFYMLVGDGQPMNGSPAGPYTRQRVRADNLLLTLKDFSEDTVKHAFDVLYDRFVDLDQFVADKSAEQDSAIEAIRWQKSTRVTQATAAHERLAVARLDPLEMPLPPDSNIPSDFSGATTASVDGIPAGTPFEGQGVINPQLPQAETAVTHAAITFIGSETPGKEFQVLALWTKDSLQITYWQNAVLPLASISVAVNSGGKYFLYLTPALDGIEVMAQGIHCKILKTPPGNPGQDVRAIPVTKTSGVLFDPDWHPALEAEHISAGSIKTDSVILPREDGTEVIKLEGDTVSSVKIEAVDAEIQNVNCGSISASLGNMNELAVNSLRVPITSPQTVIDNQGIISHHAQIESAEMGTAGIDEVYTDVIKSRDGQHEIALHTGHETKIGDGNDNLTLVSKNRVRADDQGGSHEVAYLDDLIGNILFQFGLYSFGESWHLDPLPEPLPPPEPHEPDALPPINLPGMNGQVIEFDPEHPDHYYSRFIVKRLWKWIDQYVQWQDAGPHYLRRTGGHWEVDTDSGDNGKVDKPDNYAWEWVVQNYRSVDYQDYSTIYLLFSHHEDWTVIDLPLEMYRPFAEQDIYDKNAKKWIKYAANSAPDWNARDNALLFTDGDLGISTPNSEGAEPPPPNGHILNKPPIFMQNRTVTDFENAFNAIVDGGEDVTVPDGEGTVPQLWDTIVDGGDIDDPTFNGFRFHIDGGDFDTGWVPAPYGSLKQMNGQYVGDLTADSRTLVRFVHATLADLGDLPDGSPARLPASLYSGVIVYLSDLQELRYSDGISWRSIGSGGGGGVPAGILQGYSTALPVPPGYLRTDGATVSAQSYPALYAAIGGIYNTGSEAPDEFSLPLQDNTIIKT
jgi:hypothetical protein